MKRCSIFILLLCAFSSFSLYSYAEKYNSTRDVAVRFHVSSEKEGQNIQCNFYLATDTLNISYALTYDSKGIGTCYSFEPGNEYLMQIYYEPKSTEKISMGQFTQADYTRIKNTPATWIKFSIPLNYESSETTEISIAPKDYNLPIDEKGNIVFSSIEEYHKYQKASRQIVPVFNLGNINL